MKTTQEINLIDGNFTPSEAKAMLLSMLNYKLNFHKIKKLSSYERLGKEDETSLKRIETLNESVVSVQQLFENLDFKNNKIVIKSIISISVEELTPVDIEII